MNKSIFIAACCLLVSLFSAAQQQAPATATLTATVVDDANRNQGIPGAVVELAPVKDSTKKKYAASGYQGKLSVPGLAYGSYKMKVSFLGYKTLERTVSINAPKINLGVLALGQEAKKIDAITLEVQAMRTSQKGDTVSYNANAFKVTRDADAEGLLAKMPGVTVLDGQVEAQGETVKKVFVDGKEFFGNDVSSALKNLPAEMVSKVEVFNKLSDQAQFTGIDDGEGYKAINIVTDPGKRIGQFGKLYAGYGFDDKYIVGGNVNIFKGQHRISLIGLFNNINQQNFSTEDILGVVSGGGGRGGMSSRGRGYMRGSGGSGDFMVPSQNGVSTVASAGINYSSTWWQKVDVQGSYFFNTNRNVNDRFSETQYFGRDIDKTLWKNDTLNSASRNYNHRFNAKLEYKIDDNQMLMIRPSLSFQRYATDSYSNSLQYNTLSNEPGQQLLSLLNSVKDSKSSGYNISNSALYRTRLGKPGRTLMVDFSFSVNRNDRDANTDNKIHDYTAVPPADPDSVYMQYIRNLSNGYSLSGSAIYTEPINDKSQLSLSYRASYTYSDNDKKLYPFDYELGILSPTLDENLSNIYNSGYLTHRVGPGYRLGDKKNMLAVNGYYQRSTLAGDQTFPTYANGRITAQFNNLLYFAMWNYTFNPTNTMRLFLRSSTNNPSVKDLQDVVDNTNPQNVSRGNPNLKPTYSHSMFWNYNRSSVSTGRTFMLMLGANLSNDYIADSLINNGSGRMEVDGVVLEPHAQYTRPVNMNGNWNVRAAVNYGFPVKWIKSNLNLNAAMTYNEAPSYIDGAKNINAGYYYNYGAVLGSNISENIDFTLYYNGGYNITRNSIQTSGKKDNTFMTHSAGGKFKWVAWAGFTLTGNASYMRYKGITDDFNMEYLICDLYVGKKFLPNQRGEFRVGIHDMLNQNKSYSRDISSTSISNITNNVIGRYWGIQFTYNLRNFGGRKSRGVDPESFTRPGDHPSHGGMPGGYGPPPGGGHGRPF